MQIVHKRESKCSSEERRRIADAVDAARKGDVPVKCPSAAEVTAKWRQVPYTDQLARKCRQWIAALATVTEHPLEDKRVAIRPSWPRELVGKAKCAKGNPPCCPLETIVPADEAVHGGRDYYRNKTEFTVGFAPNVSPDSSTPFEWKIAIGYALGLVRDGEVRVSQVTHECITTGRMAKNIPAVLTHGVERSGQPPYDECTRTGYWHQVTCRTSPRIRQALISIMVSRAGVLPADTLQSEKFPWTDEQCQEEVRYVLEQYFRQSTSFGQFWQPSDVISAATADI